MRVVERKRKKSGFGGWENPNKFREILLIYKKKRAKEIKSWKKDLVRNLRNQKKGRRD